MLQVSGPGDLDGAFMTQAMEEVLDSYFPKDWRTDESTRDTARRFVKYLLEYRKPLDVEKIFGSQFDLVARSDARAQLAHEGGIVLQRKIPFRGICEHHLLPMHGYATIAYIPVGKVLGLSKFARLVEGVGTERPSLQERMGDRIADLMVEYCKPKGVHVILESEHTCMSCRGIAAPGVVTISAHTRGVFIDNAMARSELMQLVHLVI